MGVGSSERARLVLIADRCYSCGTRCAEPHSFISDAVALGTATPSDD
jgi:hypothetical protein